LEAVAEDHNLVRANLAVFARWVCDYGTDRNVVKSGMALLGTSGSPDDVAVLRRLGLLEELSLYAIVALRRIATDPEEIIFDLAQQVVGWGRIQAIRHLRNSQRPDVRSWLIRGGAENLIGTEKVALIAASTGHLREALEGPADEALLDGAGDLLRALALGGGAPGDMPAYGDEEPALSAYARHMSNATLSLKRLNHLIGLERYLRHRAAESSHLTPERRTELLAQFHTIVTRPEWMQLVQAKLLSSDLQEVKQAMALATRFQIDDTEFALSWLSREPFDAYLWQSVLRRPNGDPLSAVLDLAERTIPLERLSTGAVDDPGFGPGYEADFALQLILLRLKRAPGLGWNLIRAGLNGRVNGTRSTAVAALAAWPRETWPDETAGLLRSLEWREPQASIRKAVRELLPRVTE
jgi:hypothetical protein